MPTRRTSHALLALLCLSLLAACGPIRRAATVPAELTENVTVLGIPNARFWADTDGGEMLQEAIAAADREAAANPARDTNGQLPKANFLAISGGGDDGAYGAGLLTGWSDSGRRPTFKIVTGVSTGSLAAPFAFLGSAYDAQLKAVYTTIGPRDIFQERWLPTALFSDALSDTTPLYHLIQHYADQAMMDAIADAYRKGRLLLIGTTNLDVQRPVIWNIGAIAASGKPGALELFHKILLASAAVPGAFPPVMIDVEANGQHYQELHVDGGAVAQTFLFPTSVGQLTSVRADLAKRNREAWIIRNGRLDPDWAEVDRSIFSIVGRSIATMIHYSGYNDVVRIYFTAQRDNIGYNLAYIPKSFQHPRKTDFDTEYMRALFDLGYQQAIHAQEWHSKPPLFVEPDGTESLDSPLEIEP